MTKVFLFMWMCSAIPGNQCIKISTPQSEFNEMYNCTLYGYTHSSEIIESFGRKIINEKEIFTKFICKAQEII
jgi:hypothetical protein